MKKVIISLNFILIIGLFFSSGFISCYYKLPPYNLIKKLYNESAYKDKVRNQDDAQKLIKVDNQYQEDTQYKDSISEPIEINNEIDVINKRNNLIKYIWKQEKFSKLKYPIVKKEIYDKHYSNLKNLEQIDELTTNMEYHLSSVMYHFHSSKSINKIIIYHEGHSGDFINGISTISEFLNNGYDVIAISMPLLGANQPTEIELNRFGKLKFTSHNQFIFLDNEKFSSIKFFIEPVIEAVNYAQKLNYKEIDMVGLSGGGWTTVLAAAVDSRITKSYPVAGSYPMYLRFQDPKDYGDYEQVEPALYSIAGYLELYILGSYGDGRRQVQIINIYDSCCYAGYKFKTYENIVYEKMRILEKGNFFIFADDTHQEHKISQKVLDFIINDLK